MFCERHTCSFSFRRICNPPAMNRGVFNPLSAAKLLSTLLHSFTPSFLRSFYFSFFILLSSLLLLVSCKVERPKEVLPPSKMEDVLYDYHLAQVMGSDLTGENTYKRGLYVDYVFQKHHVTSAQLDSSLVWYARNPKELSTIYEHLGARMEREMNYLKQRQSKVSARGPQSVEGDSADLWYDNRHLILTPTPLENYRSVSIPFDANFHKCDTIRWTFDALFIGQPADSNRLAVASLIVRYANDSVLARDVVLTENAPVSITLQNADSVNVKNVTAGVYFQSGTLTDHLVVACNRLLRYHKQVPKDTTQVVAATTDSTAATKKSRSLKKKREKKNAVPSSGKEKDESARPTKDVKKRENIRMDAEE